MFLDSEERANGVDVYVRGSLVEFSLNLINSMYFNPNFEDNVDWGTKNINRVCFWILRKELMELMSM